LKGDIDDLRFYDRALSEDRIRALASPDPVAEEVAAEKADANSPDVPDAPDDTNAVVGHSDANESVAEPSQPVVSGAASAVEDRLDPINQIALYVLLALVAGILIYAGIKLFGPSRHANGRGLRWVASLESAEGADDKFRIRLGVMCEADEDNRIRVVDIIEGSPADRAGLRTGDVILEIGRRKVESVQALVDCMERLKGREKLEIVLIRPGGEGTPEKLVIGLKTA